MCLSPIFNDNFCSKAYKKGLREFNCGVCPECLNARSSEWALRCVMQAKDSKVGCMVTLTYDTFKRDKKGNILCDKYGIPLENLSNRHVDVRDCQLFLKRLREYFSRKKGVTDIKYLLSAEYGKRTHRPHYHCILFGVKFDDLKFHKKSQRGNSIYISKTLDKLWRNGICTVDCININSAVARYCTKYTMKNYGIEDTFMLCSQKIGLNQMLKEFNGKSYIIDGREHPIPSIVWNHYIFDKYKDFYKPNKPLRKFTYKYVNREFKYNGFKYSHFVFDDYSLSLCNREIPSCLDKIYSSSRRRIKYNYSSIGSFRHNLVLLNNPILPRLPLGLKISDERYISNCIERSRFRNIRDNDPVYKSYLKYWKDKNEVLSISRPKPFARVALLPDKKYHQYKAQYFKWHSEYFLTGYKAVPPRKVKRYIPLVKSPIVCYYERHLPFPPCLKRASDRKKVVILGDEVVSTDIPKNISIISLKKYQLSLDIPSIL